VEALATWQLAFCAAVIVLAFAVRGTAGFGGGAIAVPLLALALPVQLVIAVVTVLNLLASIGHGLRHWRHIVWRELAFMLPFMLLGVGAGLYLLNELDTNALRRALGVFVIAYALFALASAARPLRLPHPAVRPAGGVLGTLAGFVGAAFGGAAGPLYAIYYSHLELARDAFRVTITTTLLMQASLRVAGYAGLGFYDWPTLLVLAVAIPFMLIGGRLAEMIATRIELNVFNRIVALVLIVSGAALLAR
jgi:uncharacterized protein